MSVGRVLSSLYSGLPRYSVPTFTPEAPEIFALPSLKEFIVIIGMLVATYSTRLIGWLILRNRPVSPAMQRVLDAAPGCVMISIVAPAFMTTDPATLITLFATVLVAFRASLSVTILFGVAFNALLQTFL